MTAVPDYFYTKARELYGRINMQETYKAAKDILAIMEVDEIPFLSEQDIRKNIPGANKISYIRALKIMGANVDDMEKSYFEYLKFRDKYKAVAPRQNIRKIYENYYKPVISKFSVDALVNNQISHAEYQKWLEVFLNMNKTKSFLVGVLKSIGAHAAIQEQTEKYEYAPTKVDDLYEVYRLAFREKYNDKPADRKHFGNYIDMLYKFTTLENIHVLSLDDAISYTKNIQTHTLVTNRIFILELLEYPHVDKLYELQSMEEYIFKERQKISEFAGSRLLLDNFMNIFCLFGGNLDNILTHPSHEIARIISQSINHFQCLAVVRYKLQDNPEKLSEVEQLCDYKYKKVTLVDNFKSTPWRTKLISDITTNHSERVYQHSAYPERVLKKLQYTSVVLMNFIEGFTTNTYQNITDTDPVKWFLENCTIDDIKDVILEYGFSIEPDNSRVKNCVDDHHAKKGVSSMISFFKIGVSHIIPCGSDVLGLNPNQFLVHIDNKRVIADPTKRRVYKDEEIEKMIELSKGDSVQLLILTILREIGLRSGALLSLKIRDLYDEFGTPRHICKVLEKGNKIREFATTPNMKRLLVTVYRELSEKHEALTRDMYMFSRLENRSKPMAHNTLLGKLKTLAVNAGVTDVNMHPHAFRHTIVGKLIDAGNSTELVSKFIGHSSVDTTVKYYHLMTIDDMMEKLQNPFSKVYRTKQEIAEDTEQELNDLNDRLCCALKIIELYDQTLQKGVDSNMKAADVHKAIHKIEPGLEKLVRHIANSTAGSTLSTCV